MKRNFRSALRSQLRFFEIPLCQAACKMHSAREPHTGTACGIGKEKQEKQQLPNTSQEISAMSRNRMLSLLAPEQWFVTYFVMISTGCCLFPDID